MQLAQALLQLFEFFAVFLVLERGREVHLAELLHLLQGEALLEGFTDIFAVFQDIVNRIHQQLQGITGRGQLFRAVQDVPWENLPGLLHKVVIGIPEQFVLAVLPQVVIGHTPLGLEILFQGMKPFVLFVPVDVQEELQHQITAVAQLALELVDRADPLFILLPRDVTAQVFPDRALHPARVIKHDLPVFGDGGCILIQEGVTLFPFREHHRGNHIVEAGVDLADEGADHASLSRGSPALEQDDNGQLCLADQLLLCNQALTQGLDLAFQFLVVFVLCAFVLFEHFQPLQDVNFRIRCFYFTLSMP